MSKQSVTDQNHHAAPEPSNLNPEPPVWELGPEDGRDRRERQVQALGSQDAPRLRENDFFGGAALPPVIVFAGVPHATAAAIWILGHEDIVILGDDALPPRGRRRRIAYRVVAVNITTQPGDEVSQKILDWLVNLW